MRVTYLVKGTITRTAEGKEFAIRFRSVAAAQEWNTSPVLGVTYTGSLAGKSLRGGWRAPPSGGAKVEGEFALELTK